MLWTREARKDLRGGALMGPGPALDAFLQEAPKSVLGIGPDGVGKAGKYERVAVVVRDRAELRGLHVTKGVRTAALAVWLDEGVSALSLTPRPGGDRTEEVFVAQQVLQSLGLRSFAPQVTACPGCGRTTSTFFQQMAEDIQVYLREQMPVWKQKYKGVEDLKVAVMGCVVNGPGESKHANIGISLPGTGEEPRAPVYVDGRIFKTLQGAAIVPDFIRLLDEYVETHYAGATDTIFAV